MKNSFSLNFLLISVLLIMPFVAGCGAPSKEEAKQTMIDFFQACRSKQTKKIYQLLNRKKIVSNAVERIQRLLKEKGIPSLEKHVKMTGKLLRRLPEQTYAPQTPEQYEACIKNLKVVIDPFNSSRIEATTNNGSSKMKMVYLLEKESSGWKIVGFTKLDL